MSTRNNLYVNDRRYGGRQRPKRRNQSAKGPLLSLALLLVVLTVVVALIRYGPDLLGTRPDPTTDPSGSKQATGPATPTGQTTPTPAVTPSPTPSPMPTPTPKAWNPQLMPLVDMPALTPGNLAAGISPSERQISTTIYDHAKQIIASYNRPFPISLLEPIRYNQVPGVLTFRGNNFRNAPAYGLVELTEHKMVQTWQKGIGSLPSSSWSFSWTGTGWTGQPLLVQWDDAVRQVMNINAEKKAKKGLVEVIYATLDGYIYFLDLDDGLPTREPIKIGAPIKGTPCIDPRGYPVLYVGQGDKNSKVDGIGFRVYNLVDQSLLLFRECSDTLSYRSVWGACDSSPIFDAASDTLIYPNENGMIYTARMNTRFDVTSGRLTIDPEFTTYRYKSAGQSLQGIESSMAIFDHYGYFSDNSGILNCIDLNTMKPVWSRQLEDDSDVTPVLHHEGDRLVLYTGTEVDWQKDIIGNYKGTAFVYKIDAMSGEILWESTVPCWTKNAADQGDDINGGVMGTPIVGKLGLKDLVFFSFCMTNGIYSGNSVVAFNQSDGAVAWEYKMTHYSWSSPVDIYDAAGSGTIILPDSAGQLHMIDGATGQGLSVLQLTNSRGEKAGNIESSCAVFGNRLVVGTRGNVIVGVELK
jgi:outer membrane protein assembly factor BamB